MTPTIWLVVCAAYVVPMLPISYVLARGKLVTKDDAPVFLIAWPIVLALGVLVSPIIVAEWLYDLGEKHAD